MVIHALFLFLFFLLLEEESVDELLVSDLTLDGLGDGKKLAKLSGGERLAKSGKDLSELVGGDEALAFGIEDLERLEELLLSGGLFHLGAHHSDELGEIKLTVVGAIGLIPGLVELVVRDANAVLLEEGPALCLGDGLGAAREHLEGFLELGDLVLAKSGFGHTVNVASFPASGHFYFILFLCFLFFVCVFVNLFKINILYLLFLVFCMWEKIY